jgi:hypothetical protein
MAQVAALPRLDGRGLSRAELRARFEDASLPALLSGLAEGWRAREAWRPQLLAARFPARRFDVGRESRATVLLADLLRAEEEYIFDSGVLDEDSSLAAEYAAPPCFPREDGLLSSAVFAAVPSMRPEWRWLLIGAAGAGFTCHVDPHATCAWNTLLFGSKRWAMLPPETPAEDIFPSLRGSGGGQAPLDAETEASARAWFAHQLPRLAAARAMGLLVFEQHAGDCVFVPAHWWHVAETTDGPSVAITANYLGEKSFEVLCASAEPAVAARWRERAAAAAAAAEKVATAVEGAGAL